MKIIVVDDEIGSLHTFLDQIIARRDIECKFFKDDLEIVFDYLKNNVVDGAFLDINMPNINGVEFAKKIVESYPKIKIVFVTGTNFTNNNLPKELEKSVIGIIYKPVNKISLDNYFVKMMNIKPKLKVITFGSFDCFINGHLVKFSSSKSKELFALLIVMNGKSLTMDQAITYLWPDKELDKAKISYRDAVWRLRSTLEEIDFPCVTFSRALLSLNKENIECDYYDLLEGKEVFYNGEFLTSYDWSLQYENEIEYFLQNKK